MKKELHRSNKLEDLLEGKLQQAYRFQEQLVKERGLSSDEAFEIATQAILAPSDGPAMSDNPPRPVPLRTTLVVRICRPVDFSSYNDPLILENIFTAVLGC